MGEVTNLNDRRPPLDPAALNPGSPRAVQEGCTCAVIDNHYGNGYCVIGGQPQFWVDYDCDLHGKTAGLEPAYVGSEP